MSKNDPDLADKQDKFFKQIFKRKPGRPWKCKEIKKDGNVYCIYDASSKIRMMIGDRTLRAIRKLFHP